MRAKRRITMKGRDSEVGYDLVSLPLYMVGQIDRFLQASEAIVISVVARMVMIGPFSDES